MKVWSISVDDPGRLVAVEYNVQANNIEAALSKGKKICKSDKQLQRGAKVVGIKELCTLD